MALESPHSIPHSRHLYFSIFGQLLNAKSCRQPLQDSKSPLALQSCAVPVLLLLATPNDKCQIRAKTIDPVHSSQFTGLLSEKLGENKSTGSARQRRWPYGCLVCDYWRRSKLIATLIFGVTTIIGRIVIVWQLIRRSERPGKNGKASMEQIPYTEESTPLVSLLLHLPKI